MRARQICRARRSQMWRVIGQYALMEPAEERLRRNRDIAREIAAVLQRGINGADGQWVITPEGDRMRVYLPRGYREVADELRRRFGDQVICEEAAVRMRYA